MKQQLLLLEDVEALGKKGEVVTAKPGYVRNFLLPKKFAVIASPNTFAQARAFESGAGKTSDHRPKRSGRTHPPNRRSRIGNESQSGSGRTHVWFCLCGTISRTLFQEKGIPLEKKNI